MKIALLYAFNKLTVTDKMNLTLNIIIKAGKILLLFPMVGILITGCSGGGSGGSNTSPASTLSGVAAVGHPIVNGSIRAICAAGSQLSTTTDSTGAWQVTLSGQTLPCAVQVSGGTINGTSNTTPYHSIATAPGTVNVTPLTDLMVANLSGTATPSALFNGLTTAPAPLTFITQSDIDATLAKLRIALNGLIPLNTINPITTPFTPAAGNTSDDMLTALKTAMSSAGITFTSLLSNASVPAFTAPVTGFDLNLAAAYMGTSSGGTSPTPNITNFAGTYNLTTNDGTGATISVDSTGNVSSCKVGTIVSCSGNLTLNPTSNTASFQISGNDGQTPIDTSASVNGTINSSGAVTGSYSGNSVSAGAFNGTFTGTQALQYVTVPGYANATAQAGNALPGLIQIQRTNTDPCVTPPPSPTGLLVTKRRGSYLFNDFYFNPVKPGKSPDYIHYQVRKSTVPTVITTDAIASLRSFVNGSFEVDSGDAGYTAYEYFAVEAINSCGLRSPLSTSFYSPATTTGVPTVTGMSPSSGLVGTVITITGTNFSSTPANNTVKFNGTLATVTAATATSLTVTVPTGATTGIVTVTTAGGTATSTGSFTVTAAGGTTGSPTLTFSAAPFAFFGDTLNPWVLTPLSGPGQMLAPVFTTNLYFQGGKFITTSATATRWYANWQTLSHTLSLYYYTDPAPISAYITGPAQPVEYLYIKIGASPLTTPTSTYLPEGSTFPLLSTVCFVVGSIPASAGTTGSTPCSALGITFSRTGGTATFNSTVMYSQATTLPTFTTTTAPSPTNMSGTVTFAPF